MTIIASPLFSLFIGSTITWLVAWWYYKRAGDELKAEVKSLHAATTAIVYLLEHPDAKQEVRLDDQGRVSGIVVHISGTTSMSFPGGAALTANNDGT